MDQPQIVVGIDGSASSWRAMRWAVNRDYPSLMSLASALAEILARSECPVVARDGLAADASTSARVAFGVSGSTGGRAAMRFACTEAVRADVPVLAVRSSPGPAAATMAGLDRRLLAS